jgi:hypothetical protein
VLRTSQLARLLVEEEKETAEPMNCSERSGDDQGGSAKRRPRC